MKILKKINNKEILVDDAIYEHVNKYQWILLSGIPKRYRVATDPVDAPAIIYLRDVVWEFFNPGIKPKKTIFFKDGNKLNCQLHNLFAEDNLGFQQKNKGNKKYPKFIHFHHKKYCISMNGQYGGRFSTLQQAVDVVRKMEKMIYGEYARTDEEFLESLKPFQHLLDK